VDPAAGDVSSLLLAAGDPTSLVDWLTDSSTRAGSGSIPEQAWTTLWHSMAALMVVVATMVPLALVLAHHRRAELVSAWLVNIGRAVPTVTVVGLLVIVSLRNGLGFEPWPILIALVLLALPPVFTNTYTGVRGVDPGAVDAARAMGLSTFAVMTRLELPLALPLVMGGIRTAAVQLLATEPVAAFFGGSGLGLYLYLGLAQDDVYQVQAGAVLVCAVALSADALLALLGRLVVPRGLRLTDRPRRPRSIRSPKPGESHAVQTT
jgi:osmoprotectant transport system permease protein